MIYQSLITFKDQHLNSLKWVDKARIIDLNLRDLVKEMWLKTAME